MYIDDIIVYGADFYIELDRLVAIWERLRKLEAETKQMLLVPGKDRFPGSSGLSQWDRSGSIENPNGTRLASTQ